jgi:hypothetical protein
MVMTTKLAVKRCYCGKIRYSSRAEAKQRAARMFHRTGKMRAYRCDGGFWHLTSQDAATRAAHGER